MNTETDKANEWLTGCRDCHLLAQIIIGTFHAFIFMIQNPIKFRLSQSTKDLINFLLQNVIGPWVLFRIATRLGDVGTMMRIFYSDFLHLAVCTNAYNYSAFTSLCRGGLISGRVKKGAHCQKGGPSPFLVKFQG